MHYGQAFIRAIRDHQAMGIELRGENGQHKKNMLSGD
jgi:hypothetical protein